MKKKISQVVFFFFFLLLTEQYLTINEFQAKTHDKYSDKLLR